MTAPAKSTPFICEFCETEGLGRKNQRFCNNSCRGKHQSIAAVELARARNYRADGCKRCTKCGLWKRPSEFHRRSRAYDGLMEKCARCNIIESELSRDKERERESTFQRLYHISVEEYNKLLKRQRGRCAICRAKPVRRRLSVDHCHTTLRVRGLLCDRCNLLLGLVKDDIKLLEKMVKYLVN